MSKENGLSPSDWERIARAKGITPQAALRFKKQNKRSGLTSKQVERALVANKRGKLRTLCHHVAATGHAHLYLSAMGDKVVITGVDQLKANQKPFNKRGFGSTKHPLKPREAAAKTKKRPYLSRLDPEKRREIARRGGLAAAQKRKHKKEMLAKRGPHWTQRPENRERVKNLLAKATAANKAKKAAAGA